MLATLAFAGSAAGARDPGSSARWPSGSAVVSYESERAFAAALARHPATVVRRLPALRVAAVRPRGDVGLWAAEIDAEPGILRVERAAARRSLVEPALASSPTAAFQWQYAAVHADQVPAGVAQAAAGVTIAVIDTGADLAAPDLAAKSLHAYSVRTRRPETSDANGHGTFVAALAAGSSSNGDGVAGIAGESPLLLIQAGDASGSFTDVDEAAAIVYAVDQGAKVINLSLGGTSTSAVEKRAVDYAVSKGALLVAAVGNGYRRGNAVEYPAALLQPVGSKGVGGRGLSVAASTRDGARAPFSTVGSHLSLAAPGVDVFSALSASSSTSRYPRTALPGSVAGVYGYGSGSSFAAPQVAGAAALVWAANPLLRAEEVASILEQTATGHGVWSRELGYGVLDVAAAVAAAQQTPAVPAPAPVAEPATATELRLRGKRSGTRVVLSWKARSDAASYRVEVAADGHGTRVLAPAARRTSATYTLARGSSYRFTVTALDAAGNSLAASAPWSVKVPRR
ncbi:MAG: S8 family serine peptidase [Gaiellaceae bacterium]